MKTFNEFNRLNESEDPEQTLLDHLFTFYYKKFSKTSISEVESNFLAAAKDLIDKDELSQNSLEIFAKRKGIEIEDDDIISKSKTTRNPRFSVPISKLGEDDWDDTEEDDEEEDEDEVPPIEREDNDYYSSCGTTPQRGWNSCGGGYQRSAC